MDTKTKTRALKAKEKINRMVAEMKAWTGKQPERVRVSLSDYLALVEVGWIRDGKLSGTTLEVLPG